MAQLRNSHFKGRLEENIMKLIRTWCEDTKEGMEYLAFNGYSPIFRLSKSLWLVAKIGNKLDDVKIIG